MNSGGTFRGDAERVGVSTVDWDLPYTGGRGTGLGGAAGGGKEGERAINTLAAVGASFAIGWRGGRGGRGGRGAICVSRGCEEGGGGGTLRIGGKGGELSSSSPSMASSKLFGAARGEATSSSSWATRVGSLPW